VSETEYLEYTCTAALLFVNVPSIHLMHNAVNRNSGKANSLFETNFISYVS